MEITNQEYYLNPKGEIMICDENGTREYCVEDKSFTARHLQRIAQDFPDVYDALTVFFKSYIINPPKFQFLVVRQFIACRHGVLDSVADVDDNSNLRQEYIHCPIRAMCPMKRVPCEARITTKLGKGEEAVMRMIYEGKTESEIASIRGTSIATVVTQRQNSYNKLGVNSKAEFIILATQKQMF